MRSTVQLTALAFAFSLTLAAATFLGQPKYLRGPRTREILPSRVEDWRGTDLFFCQRETCMQTFTEDTATNGMVCPACDGTLDRMSLGERRLLPTDTSIVRKQYQSELGTLSVSVVVTGTERSSIHRPQWCLPGQGLHIVSEVPDTIPLKGREPLPIMQLALSTKGRLAGSPTEMLYAYWFIGEKREVRYHWERLFWMGWENLMHSTRYRWSYVAVAFAPRPGRKPEVQPLKQFVAAFYPIIDRMAERLPEHTPSPAEAPESHAGEQGQMEHSPDFLEREISNMEL